MSTKYIESHSNPIITAFLVVFILAAVITVFVNFLIA